MPGRMASLKKPQSSARVPLAVNPLKSQDVLAVLAERNQAVVPVGAWVEPASLPGSGVSASTSAYVIEKELKEKLRKKQEALKHFQRQVKHRVNQRIRLRKKQQLQKSYEAAEKEGFIAMHSSDPAHLTPKRTGVFLNNLNATIGSAGLPPSQLLGDGIEDRENQNQLLQQAQALSQTMKQARHRLASFKTMSERSASVFPDDTRKSYPIQEESDSEEASSTIIDKEGRENLFWSDQQDLLLEDKDKLPNRVPKIQFKNPLIAVMEEEEPKDILPESQDYLPEAQGDLRRVWSIELKAQNIEPHTQAIGLRGQAVGPKAHATELEAQAVDIETPNILMEAQSIGLEDESIKSELQDFLSPNQAFRPKDQNTLPTCQDQDFLPSDKNILIKCLRKGQHVFPRNQTSQLKWQDQDFIPKDQHILAKDQNIPLRFEEHHVLSRDQCVLFREQHTLPKCQDQDFLPSYQSIYSWQQPSVGTAERRDLLPDGRQCLPPKHRREPSSRRQATSIVTIYVGDEEKFPLGPVKKQKETAAEKQKVYDKYQSRSNPGFQSPLALQFGIDQEEDKKERQKQYLRYRRLFMDIEREQVKEQQRRHEHRKKIEKIKKKKEQQRYAEEQRILRMSLQEEPCSGEKMSEMLAQLQLEEAEGARRKQQQREKEYQRYAEALRAQIQEKMRLYNITLPPLCCCGPDFWDAHPDSCANNCIFYKNHKAYTRALQSVISSCDIPEGSATLQAAIQNFASAYRRTLKNV